MQINSSASTISLQFWLCRTGDLQNLIGCPIHYMRWHNHSSCTSDQNVRRKLLFSTIALLISREETIDQRTFSLINLPKILSQGTKKHTNLSAKPTIEGEARFDKMPKNKQTIKQRGGKTYRAPDIAKSLCGPLPQQSPTQREGWWTGALGVLKQNSFYITDYLFWLKEIAGVIMVNQRAWRSENNSFSTDY